MEFVLIGIVTALNLIFIKMKVEQKRYEDAALDFLILLALTFVFGGSYGGLVVGMVSSLMISIYFYLKPPQFFGKFVEKIKEELKNVESMNNDKWPKL